MHPVGQQDVLYTVPFNLGVPISDGPVSVDAAVVEAVDVPQASSDYQLQVDVRLNESPPRVYVDFLNPNRGALDRIDISRAGSPDSHRLMWLYANGSQRVSSRRPSRGSLGFLQQYIGTGDFEARLYLGGDFDRVVSRQRFKINAR